MSDIFNPNGGPPGGYNAQLSLMQQQAVFQQQAALQQLAKASQPSMFRQILGGIAGLGGSMLAPGLGSALSRMVGGSGGFGGGALGNNLGVNSALDASLAASNSLTANGAAFDSSMAANGLATIAANNQAANQMLAVAQQSNEMEQQIELRANLEKAKHEALMCVIQGIT